MTNDTGGLDDADEEDVVEAEVEEFENSDSESTDLDLLFCCLAYLAGSFCSVVERDVVEKAFSTASAESAESNSFQNAASASASSSATCVAVASCIPGLGVGAG